MLQLADLLTIGQTPSDAITNAHFGLNFVFEHETIGDKPWDKFDEVLEHSNTHYVRYPGGTAGETVFDIQNPNATLKLIDLGVVVMVVQGK